VRSARSKRTSRAPSSPTRALKVNSGGLVFGDWYLARKSIVAFNAKLHENTDQDTLSEGLANTPDTMHPEHISLWLRLSFETSLREKGTD